MYYIFILLNFVEQMAINRRSSRNKHGVYGSLNENALGVDFVRQILDQANIPRHQGVCLLFINRHSK